MLWLREATAVTLKIGPFLDRTDGATSEPGLSIAYTDVMLSKNGGNFANKAETSSCTHDEHGWYDCDLNTTDTGTLGRLQLSCFMTGALPVWHEFMVLDAVTYDALVGGSDNLVTDLSSAALSDLNAEVVDTLDTDTYAILGQEAPNNPATPIYMLRMIYKALVCRATQTSSLMTLYNSDGTTPGQTADVSQSETTFERGAWESGA